MTAPFKLRVRQSTAPWRNDEAVSLLGGCRDDADIAVCVDDDMQPPPCSSETATFFLLRVTVRVLSMKIS